MEWTFREIQGRTLVQMTGDCDLYHAPQFKTAILGKIATGTLRILLDLSGIRYLDSTGVGAIICILQMMKQKGGDLRFTGLAGTPRRVLEMSGLLPLMKFETGLGPQAVMAGRIR